MWPDFYRFGPQLEHKLEFDFRGFAFRAPHFGSLSSFFFKEKELFAFLILKDQTFVSQLWFLGLPGFPLTPSCGRKLQIGSMHNNPHICMFTTGSTIFEVLLLSIHICFRVFIVCFVIGKGFIYQLRVASLPSSS